jgi:hypothetical protein
VSAAVTQLVAPHVINVHTGGGSNVALAAVIVTGIVGVVAPVLTGLILWKNTGRTMRAENDRLRQSLSFERAERDRSALIGVIESIAKDLQDLATTAIEAIDYARNVYASYRMGANIDTEPAVELSSRLEALDTSAMTSLIRLGLMLGDRSEPLVAQVLAASNWTKELRKAFVECGADEMTGAIGKAFDGIEAARQEFFKLARGFTEVELHPKEHAA